jgi:uracil-DNA glycosylase family 4
MKPSTGIVSGLKPSDRSGRLANFESLNQEIIACRKCPRLVSWREEVARTKRKAFQDWDYWGKPVPGFGDPLARVLVVGLAPGAHGSNRTGRQFTGDGSGGFMYPALFRAGFANQATSTSREDGLSLRDMYISAAVRCAPPVNKPTPEELNTCQPYLEREIELLQPKVIVALGRIAYERIMHIFFPKVDKDHKGSKRPAVMVFGHGAVYKLGTDTRLLCSYHPSQQNTLTGKLTVKMFDRIWEKARELTSA